ncbi:MAG: indole-3-glycerol phosphate synthase TrpC [Oscillospiraceae bacterium]|nr:indole-3-glycerol phosphate synthase TrpC [Oscillospiraceae bacterium]
MNILHEIAQRTKERIEERKKTLPLEKIIDSVGAAFSPPAFPFEKRAVGDDRPYMDDFPFEKSLKSDDIAFICEIKKASPSKGIIAEEFPYLDIAKDYEAAGAAAISVLTEPFYFQGSDSYLREIADTVTIPLLRKDFTVDSYMIYEAKLLGASAVLLICSILDKDTLAEYIDIAHDIGLSALVETHSEEEVHTALSAGARIIGVNNRNLKTFEVDITLSERLRPLVPPDVLFVSESGVSRPEDISKLREIGADAALVGETLMRAPDKKAALDNYGAYRGGWQSAREETGRLPSSPTGVKYE